MTDMGGSSGGVRAATTKMRTIELGLSNRRIVALALLLGSMFAFVLWTDSDRNVDVMGNDATQAREAIYSSSRMTHMLLAVVITLVVIALLKIHLVLHGGTNVIVKHYHHYYSNASETGKLPTTTTITTQSMPYTVEGNTTEVGQKTDKQDDEDNDNGRADNRGADEKKQQEQEQEQEQQQQQKQNQEPERG